MKIAIFEPEPRVCGPLTWAGHLKSGMEELGHEVKTVSPTKSGRSRTSWGSPKPGGRWWSSAPDLVPKISDAPRVFDDFDLVVLPEPKSMTSDKPAAKAGVVPWYVETLRATKTRFTTALHGNTYNEKTAPYALEILGLDNFCGVLFNHDTLAHEASEEIRKHKIVDLALPYRARVDIDAAFPRDKTVGCSGRFMFNKGSHVVGLAGQHLDPDVTVEVWGSCSTGLGPSLTYTLFEVLKPMAKIGQCVRYNNTGDPELDGNNVQPFTFDVRVKDRALVRYLGNYTDPVAICGRLTVHVNLTSTKYANGIEYTTLEALDAGSLCVTPPHCSEPDILRTLVIDGWVNSPGSVKAAVTKPEPVKHAAVTIEKALSFLERPESEHRQVVEFNRERIRTKWNPREVAETMIGEALA